MAIRYLAVLGLLVLATGCDGVVRGEIYSNTIRPYTTNFNNAAVGSKTALVDTHSLKEPVTGQGISVEWSADIIRSAAAAAGIGSISYVDQQTISILFGVYKRQRFIIYGN